MGECTHLAFYFVQRRTVAYRVLCLIFRLISSWHFLFLHFSEIGTFWQPCEDDAVCRCTNEKIPYFNAPIFLENKTQIGKIDEIFGPIRDFVSFEFAVQLHDRMLLILTDLTSVGFEIYHIASE